MGASPTACKNTGHGVLEEKVFDLTAHVRVRDTVRCCLDRPLQKKKYKRRAYYAQSLKLQGVKGHTDMRHAPGVYTPQSVYVVSSEKQRENVGSKKKRKEKRKRQGAAATVAVSHAT